MHGRQRDRIGPKCEAESESDRMQAPSHGLRDTESVSRRPWLSPPAAIGRLGSSAISHHSGVQSSAPLKVFPAR